MMPLPHRNTMKFFGMGDKKDYLIWRQQDGTFTALDKKLQITMWSTVTGKIIKTQASLDMLKEGNDELVKESVFSRMKIGTKSIVEKTASNLAEESNISEIRKDF